MFFIGHQKNDFVHDFSFCHRAPSCNEKKFKIAFRAQTFNAFTEKTSTQRIFAGSKKCSNMVWGQVNVINILQAAFARDDHKSATKTMNFFSCCKNFRLK